MRLATLLLPLVLTLAALPAVAQDDPYTLSGVVRDARTGASLPGATVVIAGTTLGTATTAEGTFAFDAPVDPGAYTLRVTFIGYQPVEREVELAEVRNVELEPLLLEEDLLRSGEVVVTGTGVPTERRRIGNTISSVDAEEIQGSGAVSIDQGLAGEVPGAYVQQNSGSPAGGVSIRLRGTSTVLGSADPLYIVDGVIIDNSSPTLIDLGGGAQNRLVDLNPEDVERVEIVKGAAAAALYGSRANNGVVQIFTKRGQSGEPRITLSTAGRTSGVRRTLPVNTAAFSRPEGNPAREPVERYDWQDRIFRQAVGAEQYASISGGAEGTTYFVSGGHFYNQGVVKASDFQRLNGRARLTQRLSPLVSLSIGAAYTNSASSDVPNGGLGEAYGALTGFIFGPNTFDLDPDPETGVYPDGVLANPLEVIERYTFEQDTDRFIGDVQASLSPAEGFSVDYTLGLDRYTQDATVYIPPGATANDYPEGYARRADFSSQLLNQDLRVGYQTDLSETLSSSTLVGGTIESIRTTTLVADATDFLPGAEVVGAGAEPDPAGDARTEQRIVGVFGQETLGVNDRLFLTAAARVDASSAFGADTRWNLYPKLSASYTLSDESFYRTSAVAGLLSTVRLRASLGYTGGITALGPYDRFTNYFPSGDYDGEPGYTPATSLGNLELKPERQREVEFGADLGFLGGRLALETTVYDQRTTDLLLNRSLAFTSGFNSQFQNVGNMTNRGIEVLLRALPIYTNDASWTTTFTLGSNSNEVDGVEGGVVQFPDSFGGFTAAVNGESIGVFYGETYRRDDEGQILGQAYDEGANGPAVDGSGNPVLVPAERDDEGYLVSLETGEYVYGVASEVGVIGDPNPDLTAAWTNEVEVGRFSFRAQLDAVFGQDVFNFTRRLAALSAFGTLEDYEREIEGELPPGYNGRVFSLFENWVEDGSFVKLREIAFTYRVPGDRLPLGVQGLRVTAYGRNLLSFDSYSGYDPEVNVGGQRTGVRNFDFVEVPIPRTFGLTLSASL